MECILFRHGIAVERADWDGEEALRPLTTEGKKKTRKSLAGLRRLGAGPTHLFSSPLARALQTAQLARKAFGMRDEIAVKNELLPDAPPAELLVVLASLPDNARVICVGHEPHLGAAASVMVFGKATAGLSLKKAGGCSLGFDGKPRAGRGTLNWWLTPAQLRAQAPR
ncbi:MAG TPA: histidine phosphatase family protein [Nitrospiraceae bacterium]|jgi:phosphohistidine phosphatase